MSWLIWVLGAFIFAIVGQTLILRLSPWRNGMVAFVIASVPVGLALMTSLLVNYSASPAWAGAVLYAFLCELWIFVFTSTFSSISANLMLQFRAGAMRPDEIDRLYDNRAMIRRRIGWLCQVGLLVKVDGRLEPTERGRRLAAIFGRLRDFFGHR